MRNGIKIVIVLLGLWLSDLKGAAQVELVVESKKDTVFYFIKNLSSVDTLNANTVTCTWFHMRKDVMFFTPIYTPGNQTLQYSGKFQGAKYTFRQRTLQGLGFDAMIKPGEKSCFAFVVNYATIPDTVMCGNLDFYYSINGSSGRVSVFPSGSVGCPFVSIFGVIGSANDGLKMGSFANFTMHQSSKCSLDLVAVVIDENTLKPTLSGLNIPKCADGRLWKSLGYSRDSQLFYSFNLADTLDRKGFKKFIDDLPTGSHVFLLSSKWGPDIVFNAELKGILSSLGLDATKNYVTGCYVYVYGRKGWAAGKMYLNTMSRVPYYLQTKEHFIVQNQGLNETAFFSPCFENQVTKILEQQPKMSTKTLNYNGFIVFNNPSQSGWQVQGLRAGKWVLYDSHMRIMQQGEMNLGDTIVLGDDLVSGTYWLMSGDGCVKLLKI